MDNSIIIGGITGFVSQGLTWPMEYLKTTKQLPRYKNTSIFNTLVTDIKMNGITTVYRGIAPQLLSSIPRSSIRFSVYENLKKKLQDDKGDLSNSKKLICGLTAGGVEAMTVMTPAEVIKIQTINKGKSVPESIKIIYRENGLLGFYKGGLETTLRQATTQGTSFLVYDKSKKIYEKNDYLNNYSGMLAGMTGGTMAVLVNNPIDAIKTYKQSDRGNGNLITIGKEILETKGFRGFYNGAVLRICRVAPLHGITFFTYDWLKNKFN